MKCRFLFAFAPCKEVFFLWFHLTWTTHVRKGREEATQLIIAFYPCVFPLNQFLTFFFLLQVFLKNFVSLSLYVFIYIYIYSYVYILVYMCIYLIVFL